MSKNRCVCVFIDHKESETDPSHIFQNSSSKQSSCDDHKFSEHVTWRLITQLWSCKRAVLSGILTVCICFNPAFPAFVRFTARKREVGWVRLTLEASCAPPWKGSRNYGDVLIREYLTPIVVALLILIFLGLAGLPRGCWAFRMNFPVEHV